MVEIEPQRLAELSQEFNHACELRADKGELDYVEDESERFFLTEIVDAAMNMRYAYVYGRAVAEQNQQPNIGPAAFTPSNGSTNE